MSGPGWQNEPDDHELIPAATVLILRDSSMGLEVLMLRRSTDISFAGMWVFPGGKIDSDELALADLDQSARMAAVREVGEETALQIAPEALLEWSWWIPPKASTLAGMKQQRRYSTKFFVCGAPKGDVVVDDSEIREYDWVRPTVVRARHRNKEITLAPPTWVTLLQLDGHTSVESVLKYAESTPPELFRTRGIGTKPLVLAWQGDCNYDLSEAEIDLKTDGARHRLTMGKDEIGPCWDYQRSC